MPVANRIFVLDQFPAVGLTPVRDGLIIVAVDREIGVIRLFADRLVQLDTRDEPFLLFLEI